MTRDRSVRERVGVIAGVVMAVDRVEQTAHVLAQGGIEHQERVSLRPAHWLRLLEQIHEPTVMDTVLEPRRLGEEAGPIGFVSAFQDTTGDMSKTFIVQDA